MNAKNANVDKMVSVEFSDLIDTKVRNGAQLLDVQQSEYYVYVDMFDKCFEHYVYDLDTDQYRVAYLSFRDARVFAEFMKKEGVY